MTTRTTPMAPRSSPRDVRVGGVRIYGRSQPFLFANFEGTPRVTIGRTRQCTLRLDESLTVSRRHCVITRSGEGFKITDFKSTSGVWISPLGLYSDYRRVESAMLQFGMFIRLGDAKLVVVDEDGCCPMMVARYSEFVWENNRAYNTATEAQGFIGRSRSTIERHVSKIGRRRSAARRAK